MITPADKALKDKSHKAANDAAPKQGRELHALQLVSARPEAVAQRQLQQMADTYVAGHKQPIQKKENKTGLPDNLKSGIENLSGISMSGVKVHYNSAAPAQMQAHAFAQGTDIHVASGQEKHLPHEAWHVVQQKQGRVKPTMQLKGKVNINDNAGLEKEADVMGAKALGASVQTNTNGTVAQQMPDNNGNGEGVMQRHVATDKLNVVGENHPESDGRRQKEINYKSYKINDGAGYWREDEFALGNKTDWGDAKHLRLADLMYRANVYFENQYNAAFRLGILQDQSVINVGHLQVLKAALQLGITTYLNGVLAELMVAIALNKEGKYPLTGHMSGPKLVALFKDIKEKKELITYTIRAIDAYPGSGLAKGELLDDIWIAFLGGRQAVEESVNDNLKGRTDMTMQRSMHMHNSANAGAGTLGIWKVGEQHATDIQQNAHGFNYKLVTRAEFANFLHDFDQEIDLELELLELELELEGQLPLPQVGQQGGGNVGGGD